MFWVSSISNVKFRLIVGLLRGRRRLLISNIVVAVVSSVAAFSGISAIC